MLALHTTLTILVVHDEQQLSVVPQEVDRVKLLLENSAPEAGRYYNFRVPITASADHAIRGPLLISTIVQWMI